MRFIEVPVFTQGEFDLHSKMPMMRWSVQDVSIPISKIVQFSPTSFKRAGHVKLIQDMVDDFPEVLKFGEFTEVILDVDEKTEFGSKKRRILVDMTYEEFKILIAKMEAPF